MRIGILMGGTSGEREVSLATGKNIFESIDKNKYKVHKIIWKADNTFEIYKEASFKKLENKYENINKLFDHEKFDIVILALHGKEGEDGVIQGFLELSGIPYTGSDLKGSLLGMDKYLTKLLFNKAELDTPKFIYKDKTKTIDEFKKEIIEIIGFPCIIKPNSSGSSIGLSKVNSVEQLDDALDIAFKEDEEMLVEEFIKGTEISVSVLENDEIIALPICEIVPPGDVFDYTSKYDMAKTQEIIPARISESDERKAKNMAIKAHKVFGCRGYSRLDALIDGDTIYALEINTLPGFTKESLFPKMANYYGLSNSDIIECIIKATLKEVKDEN